MFMTVKQASENGAFLIEESEFFALREKFRVRTRKDVAGKFQWMQRNLLMVVISQRRVCWHKLTARR